MSMELPDRVNRDNRPFWREFLKLYERLPELWDIHHRNYRQRDAKCEAYDVLEAKLREIEPSATRYDVQRRINIFRTNYRRERLRILKQEKIGMNAETCKPTLWFYDYMSFLLTQESFKNGTRSRKIRRPLYCKKPASLSPNKLSNEYYPVDPQTNWTTSRSTRSGSSESSDPPPLSAELLSPKIEICDEEVEDNVGEVKAHSSNYNEAICETSTALKGCQGPALSEASKALAKSWAIQYEEMAPTQRILARKAIADILFEGCMGNLRINRSEQCTVGNL